MSVENDVPEAAETTPCGQTGFTDSERYLAKIARKSFLSLWSYGNLFRNEALLKKSGNKKEICDLTVVFGNHIILFSDKACAFPSTGNLDVDWSRWYRNAVLENAKQVWGAERWILDHPENIFLDKDCSVRFPIDLPPRGAAIVHRVVVAHGSRERCTAEMDGIGSLMVVPHIVGTAHTDKQSDGGLPFAIGLVDAKKGYVHVLDDATLDIVLGSLDTVADFVAYLNKKEEFISTGKLLTAAGEEDLLAIYLQRMNDQEQHDFVIDPTMSVVTIAEGIWDHFEASPQRAAQIEANRISYEWDRMIERFAAHATAGTSEL